MPPLKYAPSSITMPAVLMSPTIEAPVRSETRLSDSTLPLMVPKTMISWALMFAFTLLFGPTVRRLRRFSLPSRSPSRYSSSSLVTSPMIFMDLPKTVGDEAGAGGAA